MAGEIFIHPVEPAPPPPLAHLPGAVSVYGERMVRIRLQNGKEATLEHGVWVSDDNSLAAFLELMMFDDGPSPADGDQEWACAHRIAGRLQAEVVAFEPVPHEHVSGRIY